MTSSKPNKLRNFALSALIATSALASSASFAEDKNDNIGPFFGKEAPGKWIIGGKISKVDLNLPDGPGTDEADLDGAGIVVGYEFARSIGNFNGTSAVELEYYNADETINSVLGGSDIDVEVTNLFFTYRSAGKLYYKLKGGVSFANFTVNSPLFDEFSDEDAGFAGGLGLGYRVGDLGVVELEYQADTSDADLSVISVNGLLKF